VRILHLCASTLEATVERALCALLEAERPLSYESVRALSAPPAARIPMVAIPAPDLSQYDELLEGCAA
jgi:hypothetical protein